MYYSVNTVVNTEEAVHDHVEFLNTINSTVLPNHKFLLQVGTPVMLLWNIKPPKLCNGIRLQVKTLPRNLVETTILTGPAHEETVFVPRIPLIPNDLEFKRLQFPLKISFAMTINKSQGETLKFGAINLRLFFAWAVSHCLFSHELTW
ncbi:hypothetical protein EVAR_57969_1 [Eumeta japonica]|uniref:DNA helicase Pif1-like 2B domain-containing protein n=1 Tax=Eumeta variegata TaxID=151549 RepID=A0A4C1Y0R5_EUMVA|nr:hypothetical protein EVAR_57969_1 [Eumeta japonica]